MNVPSCRLRQNGYGNKKLEFVIALALSYEIKIASMENFEYIKF